MVMDKCLKVNIHYSILLLQNFCCSKINCLTSKLAIIDNKTQLYRFS